MSRLYAFAAGLCGLFLAAPLVAQDAQPRPLRGAAAGRGAGSGRAAAGRAPAAAAPAAPARTAAPPPPLTPENTWNLDLSTGGRVVIQLRPDVAPQTVERIKALTRQGFYNGLTFHRVIEGFMAQGGDPQDNGTGGSTLPDVAGRVQRPAARCAARSAWPGRRIRTAPTASSTSCSRRAC